MIARLLITYVLLAGLLPISANAAKKWTSYENCSFLEKEYYDGDSFQIKITTKTSRNYIFRLYYVDTAETSNDFPDRIQAQAEEWGVTPQETIALGKEASRFTKSWFKKNKVKVHTKHQDARGSSSKKRRYAMIEGENEYLSQALVANGLARIHGLKVALYDGTKSSTFLNRLRTAENKAKKAKLGIWGVGKKKNRPRTAQLQGFEPPFIQEQTVMLDKNIFVYSTINHLQRKGRLPTGKSITVLKAETDTMARIRFSNSQGKVFEALCRIVDLTLEE